MTRKPLQLLVSKQCVLITLTFLFCFWPFQNTLKLLNNENFTKKNCFKLKLKRFCPQNIRDRLFHFPNPLNMKLSHISAASFHFDKWAFLDGKKCFVEKILTSSLSGTEILTIGLRACYNLEAQKGLHGKRAYLDSTRWQWAETCYAHSSKWKRHSHIKTIPFLFWSSFAQTAYLSATRIWLSLVLLHTL